MHGVRPRWGRPAPQQPGAARRFCSTLAGGGGTPAGGSGGGDAAVRLAARVFFRRLARHRARSRRDRACSAGARRAVYGVQVKAVSPRIASSSRNFSVMRSVPQFSSRRGMTGVRRGPRRTRPRGPTLCPSNLYVCPASATRATAQLADGRISRSATADRCAGLCLMSPLGDRARWRRARAPASARCRSRPGASSRREAPHLCRRLHLGPSSRCQCDTEMPNRVHLVNFAMLCSPKRESVGADPAATRRTLEKTSWNKGD